MSATISSDRITLAEAFAACRAQGRAALIPYVTAGHPSPADTPALLRMLAEEGADVIELGVPFSDPLADGPTIQRSSFQAIEQGVDLRWTLERLAEFRAAHDTPVVIFTYLNPILRHGVARFLADAVEAAFAASPLDLIRLIAPTTLPARVKVIAAAARGFVYYVSRTGVTGAQMSLAAGLAAEVDAVRAATTVPVAVGFGISTPEQAAVVAANADGVVVGSALVDLLGRAGVEGARPLVRGLRAAVQRPA
jgi:tryptophan synthase alpha chain